MNKLRFFCGTAFLGLAGLGGVAALAQHNHEDPAAAGMPKAGGPTMNMGMEMMQGPSHRLVMTPFVLPELQTNLSLSTQQVTQLRELKQQMLNQSQTSSSQIAAKHKELDALLASGTSQGEVVKKLFKEIGSLRGEQQFTGYETALQMKAALTDEQRTKFAAMKPREFHQAMMSHLTMNDMMEMMQFMDTGMMGRNMGGMMMGEMMTDAGMAGKSGHGMMTHEGMPNGAPR